MSIELKIPVLGENIGGGQVVGVRVSAGDRIAENATVLELETGKAVIEVPAGKAGTVEQVLVSAGDEIKVGQAFLVLSEAAPGAAAPAETAPAETPDGEIPPAQLPPEPAPHPPPPAEPARPHLAPAAERRLAQSASPEPGRLHVPAAPSVRRFARELGVDVDTVRGTGPHGRVSEDDVKRHLRERSEHHVPGAPGMPLPELPDFATWGGVRREKMSGIRYATAEQVTRCWTNIPRVTHFDQADITKLEGLRQRYKERAAKGGGNLTMAVMVVKVVALALRKFPAFNASVDMGTREIVYKDYVNIGIAVATPRGLMVPVIRDADGKNMVRLAAEIGAIAGKCRDGKVTPDELRGGTFTVTNLGAIGGSHFTPIVNFPEVAILGLGRAVQQLALADGKVEARTMLPLSLSYDHRLIDGADAAHFVRWIAEAIEEPLLLSLEG